MTQNDAMDYSNLPIREIMTKEIICLRITDSFNDISDIFNRHGFHHIPVLDENDNIVGIVSKKDLLSIAIGLSYETSGKTYSSKKYRSMTVEEIMSKDPFILEPDDTVGLAADVFKANKFHAIPIVENDELVGIITSHDLIEKLFIN